MPASHSLGWPGEAVFGYGLRVQVVVLRARPPPLAGADDGPPSLLGPCGVAMMMKRWPCRSASPSLSRLDDVAEPQRRVVADRLDGRQVRDVGVEDASRCSSRSRTPRVTSGSSAKRSSASKAGSRRVVEGTERLQRRACRSSSASARSGAAVAQRPRRPGAARGTGRSLLARNGPLLREVRDRLVERGRPAADRVLQERARDVGERAEGRVEVARTARPGSRPPGRRSRAVRPSAAHQARERACAGRTRFCMTGTRLISSGLSSSIARLRSAPRPAKRVAELGQVALRRRARRRRRTC